MKLVIEGMDGVGKSTIAKRVADTYHMKYVDGLLKTYFEDKGFSQDEIAAIVKGVESFYDHKDSRIRTWIMGFANIFNIVCGFLNTSGCFLRFGSKAAKLCDLFISQSHRACMAKCSS